MAEEIRSVFERKELILKSMLEISLELKSNTIGGIEASGHLERKEKLLSELAETDALIAALPADKKNEIPKEIVVNINSLLNDLIKTEKEIESMVSSKIEHLKGNYVNAYKKLDKNR
jgi:hypothetical protein